MTSSAFSPLCLLTIHAHADDEASKGSGTVAKYAAKGVRTVLVCCAGGEAGEVLNKALDTPDTLANLPAIRAEELRGSVAAIGYAAMHLLDYHDSGMPETESNLRPDNFHNAPMDEAVGKLVAIVRAERPQVIITYAACLCVVHVFGQEMRESVRDSITYRTPVTFAGRPHHHAEVAKSSWIHRGRSAGRERNPDIYRQSLEELARVRWWRWHTIGRRYYQGAGLSRSRSGGRGQLPQAVGERARWTAPERATDTCCAGTTRSGGRRICRPHRTRLSRCPPGSTAPTLLQVGSRL
jgi:hypothetical protein